MEELRQWVCFLSEVVTDQSQKIERLERAQEVQEAKRLKIEEELEFAYVSDLKGKCRICGDPAFAGCSICANWCCYSCSLSVWETKKHQRFRCCRSHWPRWKTWIVAYLTLGLECEEAIIDALRPVLRANYHRNLQVHRDFENARLVARPKAERKIPRVIDLSFY